MNEISFLPIPETTFASLDLPDITGSLTPFGDFLLLVAIIAILTMSMVQIIKASGFRGIAHRSLMRSWLAYACEQAQDALNPADTEECQYLTRTKEMSKDGNVDLAKLKSLLHPELLLKHRTKIAVPLSSSSLFYKMPPEQRVGQIKAAAQPPIDSPSARDEALLFVLSHEAGLASHLIAYGPDVCRHPNATALIYSQRSDAMGPDVAAADAINRTNAGVQRSLDSLQIYVGTRWRIILGYLCSLIAIISAFGFAIMFDEAAVKDFSDPTSPTGVALWMVIGLTGAVTAPILRVVAAAIRRLARPNAGPTVSTPYRLDANAKAASCLSV